MARHTIKPIDQIRVALAKLPEQPREVKVASLLGAVRLLADDIRALLQKGYTYPEIADVLAKHGVPIAYRTLRTYMSRVGGSGLARRKHAMPGAPGAPASSAKPKKTGATTPPARADESVPPGTSSARFSPVPDIEDI